MSPQVLRYPPLDVVIELHARLIDRYGGASGLRDREGLEASLARPEQIRAYAEAEPTVFALAAAIACSIIRIRHPSVDGNKRIGFEAALLTLGLNGWRLDSSEREAVAVFRRVAAGEMEEAALAAWLEANAVPRPTGP